MKNRKLSIACLAALASLSQTRPLFAQNAPIPTPAWTLDANGAATKVDPFGNPIAYAQDLPLLLDAATTPAAGAPDGSDIPNGTHLTANVTAVQGLVQVRTDEQHPWQMAVVGMVLDEGAEFRTGPHSVVQFMIPPDQIITLDRLGVVKLLQAVKDAGSVKTDVGMKYGRTRYEIDAEGLAHESTVHGPNSTLAVRGTRFSFTDQRPFPWEAISLTGVVQAQSAKREIAFGTKNASAKSSVADDQTSSELGFLQSIVDPSSSFARTPAETQLVATLISHGSVFSIDRGTGFPIVHDTTPLTDQQLVNNLPGALDFVLRWTGNANLNLGIGSPGSRSGEFVYPISGLSSAPSGGRTLFDDQGGPHGGMEIVFWPKNYPLGLYGIGVDSISGETATANIETFLNGHLISIFDGQGFTTSFTDTVPPGGTTAAIAPIGTVIPTIAGKPAISLSRPTAKPANSKH